MIDLAKVCYVNWVPANADFLTVFGASVAAIAAVAALVATLGQLTFGARSRHVLAWLSQALESEDDLTRRQVLVTVKLQIQGRLLASHYVAAWRFVEPALWTLLAPLALFLSAKRSDSTWSVILSLAFSATTLALPLRRGIRLYSERYRVLHQFAEGLEIEPVRTDLMEQMEGGTRREFRLAYLGASAALALAAAAAWASTSPDSFLPWACVVTAAVSCWWCVDAIRSYVKKIARNPPPHAVEV